MSEDKNRPVTFGEVESIVERIVEAKVVASEHRLIEAMRGMQTELLRGFESFSHAQSIRLRKVEADQSNLDTALSGRVQILEDRLLQIELKLGGVN